MRQQVEIDPLDVLKSINVLPEGEFVKIIDGKPHLYEEVSAGQHSFDSEIREMTKEEYEVYLAKETLIKFLTKKKTV